MNAGGRGGGDGGMPDEGQHVGGNLASRPGVIEGINSAGNWSGGGMYRLQEPHILPYQLRET
jgi:hypothetical protein